MKDELDIHPNHTIHLYNTHLEAGGGDEDNQARQAHVDQLIASLQNYSADVAVLFLGDTNLRASDPIDVPLLEQLYTDGGLSDSCLSVNCEETNHIDRILYRNSSSIELMVQEWKRDESFVDDNGIDLSDHPAITVQLDWSVR